MSSKIEQRVDDDLDPTRENDMSSKRDDVPSTNGGYGTSGGSETTAGLECFRGRSTQHEFQYHNEASRQSKALLEQVLNEYDAQHQEEKSALQEKILELQEETSWYKDHFSEEISAAKEKVDRQLDNMRTFLEDSVENEQEERNAALQEIEEQLILRDNEVDGLLAVIAKQSDELKQAKLEREELKKEMKSILVTLHVQFERFEDKIFKSDAEVTLLREDHRVDNDAVFGDIETIKECMVMFQEHINDVKLEAGKSILKTNKQIAVAQQESKDHLQKILHEERKNFSEYVQQQKNEVQIISSDVKSILEEQSKFKLLQDEFSCRFVETEERSRQMESSVSKNESELERVKDFVFNKTATSIEELLLTKVDVLEKLDFLTQQILNAEQDVSELSDHLKSMKEDSKAENIEWRDKFELVEDRAQKHESVVDTNINSVKQNLKAVVELLSSKLTDLRIEMNSNLISQKAINNELKKQHGSHDEKLSIFKENVEATMQEIEAVRNYIKEHANCYQKISSQILQVEENFEASSYAHKEHSNALNTKLDGLKQVIQQSSEAQSLASKDFRLKCSDFEEKLKSVSSSANSLERRLNHAECCLNTAVTPDLVEVMIQPYIKQNDAIGGNIKKQADDLKKLKDQMKASLVDRMAITEKIDSMNKTWESLFQHLVCQVKKDTSEMDALKKENEKALKDMKRLATSWENRLATISDQQSDLKESISIISLLKENMDTCNHRVSSLTDEIEIHRVFHAKLLEQKSTLDAALQNLKEDMESITDNSLQIQKNVMSEQMAKMLHETDLKIQRVVADCSEDFAKTHQDTQKAWKTIENLKDAIASCEQAIHSELSIAKKNLTDCQFEALGLRLKLQATKEGLVSSGENQE